MHNEKDYLAIETDLKAENPFDVLAKQALDESEAGETITLEEFESELKQSIKRAHSP
jgi:hypothetical protein